MFFAPLPNYGKIVALTSASRKMRLLASCFHLAAVFPQKGIPDIGLSKFANIVPFSANWRNSESAALQIPDRESQQIVTQVRRRGAITNDSPLPALLALDLL